LIYITILVALPIALLIATNPSIFSPASTGTAIALAQTNTATQKPVSPTTSTTVTNIAFITSTVTPTEPPTLNAAQIVDTQEAVEVATNLFNLTSTAVSWTKTPTWTPTFTLTPPPTVDVTGSVIALRTQRAATSAKDQANKTATATLWTKTPTQTATITPTATPFPAGFATKDVKDITMLFVPAGTFLMGSEKGVDVDIDEVPQTPVTISNEFWIDQTEVSNAAYQKFIDAGGYTQDQWWTTAGKNWKRGVSKPHDYLTFTDKNQPRVGVTWYEAYAYCAWRGGRLPTEAEWEYAARGKDKRIYPWGNDFDPAKAVFKDNSAEKSAPVGSKPQGKSEIGALDMAGNVWEWVNTIYDENRFGYPFKEDGRVNVDGVGSRVRRGGSWNYEPKTLRVANRDRLPPATEDNTTGFRCVRSLP
jgi:formylglycine-generating enzyme required for sulfatase activity